MSFVEPLDVVDKHKAQRTSECKEKESKAGQLCTTLKKFIWQKHKSVNDEMYFIINRFLLTFLPAFHRRKSICKS